jgi:hypothetical protein
VPDAAVFHGPTSPPFRIELPGALPSAVVATPDGGAIVGLTITRPITIAGTTFEPKRGPDVLVVSISGDGQPRAAVSFGLDGTATARIVDLALDGADVKASLVTDISLPGASGTPSPFTLVTVDLTRGVSDEVTLAAAPSCAGDCTRAVLADGGLLVVGACDGAPDTGCLIRTNPH